MFRKTKVCTGLMLAFGGGLMLGSLPAHAQQQLERVEITGSAIKRVNQEGPAPVETISRKDIAKTGATTVNELLRTIPSMDFNDQGELASNSPAGSGTSQTAMRGLSEDNVLVLLNGRRVPVNALYDSSGAGAAFDLNSIPISMVERIEVLKDGGSAIYGADAVAGVINIITKKSYNGIEASARYGQASRGDAKEKAATFSAGFGDLAADRWNFAFGLDLFKRDPILRKDRDLTKSVDFRSFGSRDGRSAFSPSGNVLDVNGDITGLTYRACAPEDYNGYCRYDFNKSLLTSYNAADRVSGLAQFSYMVTPQIRTFIEVTASRTKNHFEAHPVPDYFIVPINDPSQAPHEIIDPDVAPGNIYILGRFMQGGPRITDREGSMLNTVFGVEGSTGSIDWKANIGQGVSKVKNSDSNYYNADLWAAATTSGALDPTSTTNDPAFVDSLKVRPVREGKSTIRYLNFDFSGDLFNMPAGMLRYAVGASLLRDELKDTPDPLTQQGLVVGSIQQAAVNAARSTQGVFGELSIPVLKSVEAQAALRYDRYPDESKVSPKLGAIWRPMPEFNLRGSYAESFRAPVLKQLYGAQEEGAITITSQRQCALLGRPFPCTINAYQVNGSNDELKAEKAKTYNLGIVVEPTANVNASIDFWRIKKKDDISAPTITTALEQGLYETRGGRIYVFTNLQNIAQRINKGVDLDARVRFPGTAAGSLTFRNMTTYYYSLRRQDSASEALKEYANTYATPRWRNSFTAASEFGPWSVTGVLRTIGGFYDSDEELSVARGFRKVAAHEEVDLQAQFSGIKGLTLTGGVKNVFDKMPPFSAQNATDNTYTQMGFAELYNVRGRFYYVGVNYKFN